MIPFKLPDNLLLGTATAATHIEGGDQLHSWHRWSDWGRIKDGSHSKVACEHLNRVEEDVALLRRLNVSTYRFGLEWSRIEPEEGKFDDEVIKSYRYELRLLHAQGIRPLVTLWHFSNPLWFEDDGGWTKKRSVKRFLKFTEYTVSQLGDLVSDWITINEPNVYLFFSFFEGIWPPGKKGRVDLFLSGAQNLVTAHLKAFTLIHDLQSNSKVGVAHHLRVFDPIDDRRLTQFAVSAIDRVFQKMFLEAMTRGRFLFPLRKEGGFEEGVYSDFLGVNYYSRDMVKGTFNPLELFGDRLVKEGAVTNDLGWEIYAQGLFQVCQKAYEAYKLPIWITENGVCDAEDALRTNFIYEHLREVKKLSEQGVPVERYYHWSLLDNFEWAEGNSARFGLYHTDYETQERTLRKSGTFYSEIAKYHQISQSLIEKYIA